MKEKLKILQKIIRNMQCEQSEQKKSKYYYDEKWAMMRKVGSETNDKVTYCASPIILTPEIKQLYKRNNK